MNYTLDDILSNKRKTRSAAPRKLEETDPILDAFKEINNKEDLAILMQPNSDDECKNRKSSCVSKDDLDTESGTVQVKEYVLKRRKKKVKAFHCASDGCDQMEQSRKAINLHEKENHLDLSYNCTECGATNFSSYKAMFKHSQRHFKFIHVCDICNKDFQFPSQVEKHKSVHDKSKGLVCTWQGCKKILANKDLLKQHVQCHQDLKLKCDQCQESRSYPTTMSLKQHQQGQHRNGYITYCGDVCKWPDERRQHQKECLACGKAKEKKLNKEPNPRNPRKCTKTFKNRGVPKKP